MMTKAELTAATENANEIVARFNAKAQEMAEHNGVSIERAQEVMFAYLQQTAPEAAKTIAVALAVSTV